MIRVDGNGGTSSLVKVRGLNKTYSRGGEKIQVLQGLNLDVDKGDFVAFMGPAAPARPLCSISSAVSMYPPRQHYRRRDEITHMSGSKLTHWRARHVGLFFRCTTSSRCSRRSRMSSFRCC